MPLTQQFSRVHPPRRLESLLALIGNTPLIRLKRADLPENVEIWVKLEFMNPGGSIKDRTARQVILDALESGELTTDMTLIDATSGNTGIAYAMVGAALGIDVELVMPAGGPSGRRALASQFGAKIHDSPATDGIAGAVRLARELAEADKSGRYYFANQYANPSNPKAHELTTARELWAQTDGRLTHFIAATGTSGTLMGVNRGLKAQNAGIQVLSCELQGDSGNVEGLMQAGDFVPEILDVSQLDGVLCVAPADGRAMARSLAVEEGIAAGDSGGANVAAAIQLAKTLDRGVVVTVICDNADRYLGM